MIKILLHSLFFGLVNIIVASSIPGYIERQINSQVIPIEGNISYYEEYYETYKDTEAGPITANLIWQGYHMMCDTEEEFEKKQKEREYFKIFLNSFYDENHRLLDEEVINNKLLSLPERVAMKWIELEKKPKYKGDVSKLLQDLLSPDTTNLDDLLNSFDDL